MIPKCVREKRSFYAIIHSDCRCYNSKTNHEEFEKNNPRLRSLLSTLREEASIATHRVPPQTDRVLVVVEVRLVARGNGEELVDVERHVDEHLRRWRVGGRGALGVRRRHGALHGGGHDAHRLRRRQDVEVLRGVDALLGARRQAVVGRILGRRVRVGRVAVLGGYDLHDVLLDRHRGGDLFQGNALHAGQLRYDGRLLGEGGTRLELDLHEVRTKRSEYLQSRVLSVLCLRFVVSSLYCIVYLRHKHPRCETIKTSAVRKKLHFTYKLFKDSVIPTLSPRKNTIRIRKTNHYLELSRLENRHLPFYFVALPANCTKHFCTFAHIRCSQGSGDRKLSVSAKVNKSRQSPSECSEPFSHAWARVSGCPR